MLEYSLYPCVLVPVDSMVKLGNDPETATVYEPPLKGSFVKPALQLESALISANASLSPAWAVATASAA